MELHAGETTYFSGHPSWRGSFAYHAWGIIAAIAVGVVACTEIAARRAARGNPARTPAKSPTRVPTRRPRTAAQSTESVGVSHP